MRLKLLTTIIGATLCFNTTTASAGSISDQMDSAFGMMVNVTDAATYNTARRGVISGGQIFIKMPTKRVNIMSASAPKISAGCGGINLYGGSFSFLNADQFIQTFQAIGANAIGYGTKLALSSACPTCEQIMTSLEKTAQAINKMNLDTCQAAQGLVDAGVDFATTQSADAKSKLRGIESGAMDDAAQAWSWATDENDSASNSDKKNDPAGYAKEITGNIAWRSFKSSGIASVFGGDDEFLELLMTMSGTVIVNNPSTEDDSDPKLITRAGHSVSLLELINGGTIKIYSCDGKVGEDECLSVDPKRTKSVTDDGLKKRVYEAFTDSDGYIHSLQSDAEWSTKAKSVLGMQTLTGSLCTQKIREGAINKVPSNVLVSVAELCSNRMALELSHALATSYLSTARTTLQSSYTPDNLTTAKKAALEIFKESEKYYHEEFARLSKENSYKAVNTHLQSIDFIKGTIPTTQGGN